MKKISSINKNLKKKTIRQVGEVRHSVVKTYTTTYPSTTHQQLAASTQIRAWQPMGPRASHVYQATHIVILPQQQGNPRAYSSGDQNECTARKHKTSPIKGYFSKSGNIDNLPNTKK